MATVKNEPFYVTIELDVDSYDGDKNGEDSYQGISDSDLDKLGIDFRDDNVEIIHLTSSNFKDTLPGLDLFATLSGSNNGDSQHTIGLSAGLFCPVTVQWLLENFETKEGVSLPRSTVYNHYIAHCRLHEMEPVNAASFGKLIRSIFLGLQTRRLGTRGNSKYHYYGIQIKPESSLNSMTDFCGLEITDSEFENLRGPKKPAETITSGAYKAQKLRTSPQPCSSSQVNVPQEVVIEKVEIEGSPSKRDVPESESQDMVEMMSMLNVEPANTDTKELLKMNTKFPPITLRSKTMREWKKDIQLITAITTDSRRNNDLIQKVQLTAAKVASGCPKIDYRLASDIMGRSEVDQFRQGYQKLAQISVESCLMYNLDTFLLEHYKFWNGESSTMQSTSFTRAKLIVISQNECIRQYVLNVDSQVYDTVLTGLLPNNLDPLPVVVLDVLHNFVEKYLQTVSFSMEGFPDEMRNERMKSATAFLTAIRAHCELNMLADMVRPLFEELNRSKIQDALANMGVSSVKDLLSYRIDSLRRSFPNFNDLDAAARWIDAEADKALRQSKSQKEEKSLDLLARNFALDMSYLMHTILSITKFADSEVISFLTPFAAFVDSYVLHLLERRKIVHRNSSLMQYLIAFLE